ncbi:MAG: hypothetical protein JXQ73_07900 [Phycisphaerae bacterium]|nr:hypothetical protein [Phycisphaerae bacterium]
MNRREFLAASASAAYVGTGGDKGARVVAAEQAGQNGASGAPAVLASYTAQDHRRRLSNIGLCNRAIRRCMRKHLITDYLPGQCCYNLGEYPALKPWNPDDYDEQELDRLRDHGIRLIQLFDDWNDSLRLFGGSKYTPVNPAGLRRFVDMVHKRGMKVIAYISTGFLQATDPDLHPEWFRPGDVLVVGYWNMARCSPASAGWRAYLLPHVVRILDEYGFDGLYDDCGYVTNARRLAMKRWLEPTKDEIPAFEETAEHDGALGDLLQLVYAEVKRRGGIFKLHVDAADRPLVGEAKVYDYLWVGEGVGSADGLRQAVKNHPPYVVPCIDMTFAKIGGQDEPYLHAIPYMQFPVLQAGHPFTGERGMVPGVKYRPAEKDFWVRRCQEAWKFYQEHPNGPYTYGGWDSVPSRPETRPTHAKWLRRYLPMVEEGTWAWLEIGESSLFAGPTPKDVVASAFANRDLYLVLANYGHTPADVETADDYVSVEPAGAVSQRRWKLGPRSLCILRRTS